MVKVIIKPDKIISDIMEMIKGLPPRAIIDISNSLISYAKRIEKEEEVIGKLDTELIS